MAKPSFGGLDPLGAEAAGRGTGRRAGTLLCSVCHDLAAPKPRLVNSWLKAGGLRIDASRSGQALADVKAQSKANRLAAPP